MPWTRRSTRRYEGAIRGGQGQGVSRPGPSRTDELPIIGAAGHPPWTRSWMR